MKTYYYEDVEVGQAVSLGRTTVTRDEIVAYARAFDPQPFHLDEAAAKDSMIGRLCASGWHSCAIMLRLLCDNYLLDAASLGSPGMDEVKWLVPVFPDDELTARFTCLSKRTLNSRPGVGICRMLFELRKVDGTPEGTVAMTWDTQQLMGLRAAEAQS